MTNSAETIKRAPGKIKDYKAFYKKPHTPSQAASVLKDMRKFQDELYCVIEYGSHREKIKASNYYQKLGALFISDVRCITNTPESNPAFGSIEAYVDDS